MTNTIVEGDSTPIINTMKRLQNDTRGGKVQKHWRLAHSLQKIQEHLQAINTVDLCCVHRSANDLEDIIANEGVSKEGPELDITWINIPQGQFRNDYTQLATKYRDNGLRKGGHIEEGSERTVGPRQDMTTQHSTTNHNVGSTYTTGEGMTTRSCQQ
jgi:hypothetical protein